MSMITGWRWLGGCALAAICGCSSGASGLADYFTFRLEDFPLEVNGTDTTFVTAYVYVPWGPEDPTPASDPCWLTVFDLKGRAVLEVGGNRTTDDLDQQKGPTPATGTYVQYLGGEEGQLRDECLPGLTARFTFGGAAYVVFGGQLTSGFPDPKSLAIVPGASSYLAGEGFNQPAWNLEGTNVLGGVAFWPYEYGAAGANAVRLYPTESGGR